jgi:hypothetical protein
MLTIMCSHRCLLFTVHEDELIYIESFLDVEELLYLAQCCRYLTCRNNRYHNFNRTSEDIVTESTNDGDACYSAQRDLLWLSLLHHRVPGYGPFKRYICPSQAKDKVINYLRFTAGCGNKPGAVGASLECVDVNVDMDNEYKQARWEKLGNFHVLNPRLLARSTYCPSSGINFLFGGDTSPAAVLNHEDLRPWTGNFNDVWAIQCVEADNSVKVFRVPVEESSPSPTYTSASAIALYGEDLYIFGGIANTQNRHLIEFSNQFWRLRGAVKYQSPFQSSTERASSSKLVWECLTANPNSGSNYFTSISNGGVAQGMLTPPGRWGHTLTATEDMLILFGGSCPGQSFADLWVFTSRFGWKQLSFKRPLAGRGGHSAVIVGDCYYILGGNDALVSYPELWRLSVSAIRRIIFSDSGGTSPANVKQQQLEWELVCFDTAAVGGPEACIGHCVTAVGRLLVMFGGRDKHTNEFGSGIYIFDTVLGHWRKYATTDRRRPLHRQVQHPVVGGNRTGHYALLSPTGILYGGGLLEDGSISSELLHLNLFGVTAAAASIVSSAPISARPDELSPLGSGRSWTSEDTDAERQDDEMDFEDDDDLLIALDERISSASLSSSDSSQMSAPSILGSITDNYVPTAVPFKNKAQFSVVTDDGSTMNCVAYVAPTGVRKQFGLEEYY